MERSRPPRLHPFLLFFLKDFTEEKHFCDPGNSWILSQNINFTRGCWEHKESLNLLRSELCKVRPRSAPPARGTGLREGSGQPWLPEGRDFFKSPSALAQINNAAAGSGAAAGSPPKVCRAGCWALRSQSRGARDRNR